MKKECLCFECQLTRFEVPETTKIVEHMKLAIKHCVSSQMAAKESLQRLGVLGDGDAHSAEGSADNLSDLRDQIMDSYMDVFALMRCASTVADVLSLGLQVIDEKLDDAESKIRKMH